MKLLIMQRFPFLVYLCLRHKHSPQYLVLKHTQVKCLLIYQGYM